MIKIGLIGCESSHATAFSKLANRPNSSGIFPFDDVRVTHVFGLDYTQAQTLADECAITCVVNDPCEMLGCVDGVMVLFRDGSLHYRYAEPFCRQGIPVWVDKPFTLAVSEAEALIEIAKSQGGVLAGGSTCKYCIDILKMKAIYEENKGSVVSAAFNFPGIPESPYNGVHFYMPHAAEMLLTVFGSEIRTVKAMLSGNTQIAAIEYDSFSVVINFIMTDAYQFTIFTPEQLFTSYIDISDIYKGGFRKFIDAIRKSSNIEPYQSLITPVKLVNAIEQAIKTGRTIPFYERGFQ